MGVREMIIIPGGQTILHRFYSRCQIVNAFEQTSGEDIQEWTVNAFDKFTKKEIVIINQVVKVDEIEVLKKISKGVKEK